VELSRISQGWVIYPEHVLLGGIALALIVAAVVLWFWFDPTIEIEIKK
jgi:hypothetical protein